MKPGQYKMIMDLMRSINNRLEALEQNEHYDNDLIMFSSEGMYDINITRKSDGFVNAFKLLKPLVESSYSKLENAIRKGEEKPIIEEIKCEAEKEGIVFDNYELKESKYRDIDGLILHLHRISKITHGGN